MIRTVSYILIHSCLFLDHVGQLRRLRRRVYAPTRHTAGHDNHKKINSRVSFAFPWKVWGSAWRPFGPPELRYSNQINARALIGQLAMVYCASKPASSELLYITIVPWARVGYNHFISNKGEWNNCFSKFSNRVLPPIFVSTILQSVRKEHTTSGHTRPDSRHHLIIT